MKKNILLVISVFFTIQGLYCQTLNCTIKGTLAAQLLYKYAYLFYPETNSKIISPIIKNQFQFNISKPKEFEKAILFLAEDSLKTYTNVFEDWKNGIHNSRSIAIEDMEIVIKQDVSGAIVKGGILNSDMDQMALAIKSGEYEEFFTQHINSPVLLMLLRSLNDVNKKKLPFGVITSFNVKYFYSLLTDSLKKSDKGKEIWRKIITD